ncbi:hypothetical protein P154DRAFT_233904 [Amniculicola lignicola CBS 123094]|uniref:Uncharacterized protein n=1 Tax=Amniculicola lignicola CBS 123094 TaxID=1392246 RepID=A0A6A5WNC4_9PLEO|nr:hypothetical protein P154DRAFT_233904 [Amniculicola lignicola CBS 123094]
MLPHLSPYRLSFRGVQSRRSNVQTSLLGAALFNSTLSFNNRLLGTVIIKRIKACLQVAEQMLEDYHPTSAPRPSRTSLSRMLCTAVSQSGASDTALFGIIGKRPTLLDEYCIASMLGCLEVFLSAQPFPPALEYRKSALFGSPIDCAVKHGCSHLAKVMQNPEAKAEHADWIRTLEEAIDDRDTARMSFILQESYCRQPFWIQYGVDYARLIERAIDSKDSEVVRGLYVGIQPKVFHGDIKTYYFKTRWQYETVFDTLRRHGLAYAAQKGYLIIVSMMQRNWSVELRHEMYPRLLRSRQW